MLQDSRQVAAKDFWCNLSIFGVSFSVKETMTNTEKTEHFMQTLTQMLKHSLPFALEIARQLHDARKPMYGCDITLQWGGAMPCYSGHISNEPLKPFLEIQALRYDRGRYFLPRRIRQECPFHNEVCLPTREDTFHHAMACQIYVQQRKVLHQTEECVFYETDWFCPTFLVDLLDPWPRDVTAPVKTTSRTKTLPVALRYFIMQRDGGRCQLCGSSPKDGDGATLEVDHKVSRAHGGTDSPDNLLTLCALCNSGKGLQSL